MGCGVSSPAVPSVVIQPETISEIPSQPTGRATGQPELLDVSLQGQACPEDQEDDKTAGDGKPDEPAGQHENQSRALKAILDDIKSRGPLAHALGPPEVTSAETASGLDDLGDVAYDLHVGMPPAMKRAPLQLLRIASVLNWDLLLVYEVVPEADCLQIGYCDTDDKLWARVVTVSWRWSAQKLPAYVEGFSPMSKGQFSELKALLKVAADSGLEYVWIDWSCVPQYDSNPMVEVHRSKVFFVRARTMLVLPTFKPLPEGIVRVILGKAARLLQHQAQSSEDLVSATVAGELLSAMLEKNLVAGREYFGRVWTLAERMARHSRDEGLCHWLSLEAWLGMLVDAMLQSTEDQTSSRIYRKMLGPDAAVLLDAVLGPLATAVEIGSVYSEACDGLDARVAKLCKAAVTVWQQSSLLAEAPTRHWLDRYLGEEARSGVYQAWNKADLVWAVYSYFCWKSQDQGSTEGLRRALEDLVAVAGGDKSVYKAGMYTHLGMVVQDDQHQQPQEEQQQQQDHQQQHQYQHQPHPIQPLPPPPMQQQGLHGKQQELLDMKVALAVPTREATRDLQEELVKAAETGNLAAVTSLLADPKLNPNVTDYRGEPVLLLAAGEGHTEIVQVLLAAGADKHAKDRDGVTALHAAAGGAGSVEVVQVLLAAGADLHAKDNEGMTPLLYSAISGKAEAVKVLLKAGADISTTVQDGNTALHWAALNGNQEVVRVLLEAGADKEARGDLGATALHAAAAKDGKAEVAKVLLASGASKDAKDSDGNTPLHWAAYKGHTEMVQVLLEAGADKDNKDNVHGVTALHVAAKHGKAEVIKALLAAGASKDIKDNLGYTPLRTAQAAFPRPINVWDVVALLQQ